MMWHSQGTLPVPAYLSSAIWAQMWVKFMEGYKTRDYHFFDAGEHGNGYSGGVLDSTSKLPVLCGPVTVCDYKTYSAAAYSSFEAALPRPVLPQIAAKLSSFGRCFPKGLFLGDNTGAYANPHPHHEQALMGTSSPSNGCTLGLS